MTVAPPNPRTRVRADIPAAQRTHWTGATLRASRPWLVMLAGVGVWELLVNQLDVPKYILPAPSAILSALTAQPLQYLEATWATTSISLLGFATALIVGVAIAIPMARSALFEELVYPFLNIIRVMPTVAIAPLLIIWFGRGTIPIVVCSFLIAFFPIVVSVAHGLTSVDEDLISMMRLANASEWSILTRIRIPSALPHLFSSFRIAAPGAVVGTLLGEFISARAGLGYLITVYSAQLNTAAVFLLALLSCLVGIVFFNACVWAERILVPWRTVVR